MTNYNPFDPVGRYNIETYLYDNKRVILGTTLVFIFLLLGLSVFLWNQKQDIPQKRSIADLPEPRYGVGPYGYGLYAPPRELMED